MREVPLYRDQADISWSGWPNWELTLYILMKSRSRQESLPCQCPHIQEIHQGSHKVVV